MTDRLDDLLSLDETTKISNPKKDTKAAPYHNVLTSSWNILAPPPAAHHLQTEILYTVTLLSYRNHVVNFNNVNTAAIPTIVVNVLCV